MKKKAISILLCTAMTSLTLAGCGASSAESASTAAETQAAASTEAAAEASTEAASTEAASSEAAGEASTEAAETSADDAQLIEDIKNGDPKGQTITFWHSMGGVNGEAMDALVKKFNEENTDGITVDAQYQGSYDDAINKLKSAQIGNMGADLVQIYDIGTRFMIDSGWIIPMQDMIDADGWDVSQIEPNIAAYYTVGDKLYSMPFNSSTPLLYYNKDMFDKAGITDVPTSLEGIGEIGDKLMNDGGATEVMSFSIYGWFFEQFCCKQGKNYVNNGNGREAAATAVEFDSNGAGSAILNEWKDLSDKGYAPIVGTGGDAGLADFTSGKSAITLGSTASLKQVLEDVGGKFEVGTAYFPKVTDSDNGGVSIGGASLWALNNNDPDKDAAVWEFIKFLTDPENQAYWNTQTGYFPINVNSADTDTFKKNVEQYPQFQTAIDQLHDSAPEYTGALLSVFPEARQDVETEIENMLNGKESPDEAVSAMAENINSAIEDYNLLNE